jgi:hypothetical protein
VVVVVGVVAAVVVVVVAAESFNELITATCEARLQTPH